MSRLLGRKIIVTGAASGIGAATVRCFLEEGAQVTGLDVNGDGLDAFGAAQEGLLALPCDVTDHDRLDAVVEQASRHFGGLDGVVNCAAIDAVHPIEESSADMWRRMFEINVIAAMMLCRRALEAFSGPAAIVNVASAAGLRPLANRTAYCASKAALIMATKALAVEVARRGVRVNALCPGVIDTPMLRRSWEAAADPDAAYREVVSRNALTRIADPEEVAKGILYLMSDDAAFVTGTALAVDGGRAFH